MKKLIFFLVYMTLMIGIPVGVYHYPVKDPFAEQLNAFDPMSDDDNTIDPSMNGSDPDVDSVNPYLSIDRHWQDSVNSARRSSDSTMRANDKVIYQELLDGGLYNESVILCLKMINAVIAICFCFGISMLAAFIMSILKLMKPSLRIGWFITGMCTFNLLYVIGTLVAMFMIAGGYAWYIMLPLFSGATSVKVVVITLLVLYVGTIIFTAIGAGRARPVATGR